MDDPAEYGKALKLIRRRRIYLFSVILIYIPSMWIINSVSPAIRTMLTAFVIWVVMLTTTCLMAAMCKCPRCGNYFHVHGMTMLFLRKCLHCQLHINADRTM